MAIAKDGNRERLNITMDKKMLAEVDEYCYKYGLNRSAFIGLAIRSKLDNDLVISKFPEMLDAIKQAVEMEKSSRNGSVN